MFRRFLLLIALALPASAQNFQLGTLLIGHPWSRPTSAGMPMGVAYLSITNNGKVVDALIAASTPAAARVEMHRTTIADGVARMRPVDSITIAPGSTARIEPGGMHLMLVDLKAPLHTGAHIPLELTFRNAGRITVQVDIAAAAP